MKRLRRWLGPQYSEPVWLWTDAVDGAVDSSDMTRKEVDEVMSPVELENKVALIVGGASDKGHGLAVSFAERGMDVAVVYYDGKDEAAARVKAQVEALGRRCLLVRGADATSLDQDSFAQWAVASILEQFGRLDVFINVSEKHFSLGALNGNGTRPADGDASGLFPHFRMMKAALDEIVS